MTTDPEIIKDLLPLYRSGLASPASRRLVESWLAENAPAAGRTGPDAGEDEDSAALRALDEARRRARRLRWLFALAVAQTVLCLATRITIEDGAPVSVRLLAFDMPWLFVPAAAAALLFWALYLMQKRRLA